MTVGSEIILSEDDVSFREDRFEETERERSFLGNENMERTLVMKGPRLPLFFKSGA